MDEVSPHTSIEEVYIEHIHNISIDDVIHLDGDATICVNLHYGSERDDDDEDESSMSFPMDFSVEINWEETIESINYTLNTESFYE